MRKKPLGQKNSYMMKGSTQKIIWDDEKNVNWKGSIKCLTKKTEKKLIYDDDNDEKNPLGQTKSYMMKGSTKHGTKKSHMRWWKKATWQRKEGKWREAQNWRQKQKGKKREKMGKKGEKILLI